MRKIIFAFLMLVGLFGLYGCGSSASAPSSPAQIPTAYEGMDGYVQKGPFILGSTVYIQELDDDFVPTGNAYFTQTNDDLGSFTIASTFSTKYVEITTQGFYFNEVTGQLSDAPLTLRSVSDLSEGTDINVNLLTTLAKGRIQHLVSTGDTDGDDEEDETFTYSEAVERAEGEVLSIFNIDLESETEEDGTTEIKHFDKMDISQAGNSNAILLAVSSVLQGTNTVGELSELISKIIADITPDGILNATTSEDIVSELNANNIGLSLSEIRNNLVTRYAALGLTASVPMFEDYINSDASETDITINKYDDDTHVWIRVTASADWTPRAGHTALYFDNKLWIMGGLADENETTVYKNDIWYSSDGATWTEVEEPIDWHERAFHTSVVFDNKMWIMAGASDDPMSQTLTDIWSSPDGSNWEVTSDGVAYPYSSSVVLSDTIWNMGGWSIATFSTNSISYSSDGETWENVATERPWATRHNFASVVFDDKIWIIAGYHNIVEGGLEDIWYSPDGTTWTEATDAAEFGQRTCHAVEVFENKMWLLGGSSVNCATHVTDNGGITNNGNIFYSADGITWTEYAAGVPWTGARMLHRTAVANDRMWVFGGKSYDGIVATYYNDVWYFINYQTWRAEQED